MNKHTLIQNDFPRYLDQFLNYHLTVIHNCSHHTFASYCDTFTQLLEFMRDQEGITAEKLQLVDFNKATIERFLSHIEEKRRCKTSTRNVRLAALHSFFRYLQYDHPEFLRQWAAILAIPYKKTAGRVVSFLNVDGMKLLLSLPDQQTTIGRRDLALLSLMYATGCRVQELCDLTPSSLRFSNPPLITIIGKGRKPRMVPLRDDQLLIMKQYMQEHELFDLSNNASPLFPNRQQQRLTRQAVSKILEKYIIQARNISPDLIPEKFSCHCIRHSLAIHLLQAGVNLIYIRDILGHASIKTTEIYARVLSKQKFEALEKAYPHLAQGQQLEPFWKKDKGVLAWLNSFKYNNK